MTFTDVAGRWEGSVMPMDKDSVLTTIALVATPTKAGWTMQLAKNTPIPLWVSMLDADSVVTETASFPSVLRPGKMVRSTRSVYHLSDGKLVGSTRVIYEKDTVMLRTVAVKH